jgi:hypothetical protein
MAEASHRAAIPPGEQDRLDDEEELAERLRGGRAQGEEPPGGPPRKSMGEAGGDREGAG